MHIVEGYSAGIYQRGRFVPKPFLITFHKSTEKDFSATTSEYFSKNCT